MADQLNDGARENAQKAEQNGGHDSLINRMAQEKLLLTQQSNQSGNLMSFDHAPDNALTRYGMATAKGLTHVPEGMWKAAVQNVEHPTELLQTAAMGAGTAFVLKTLLPEGGMAGKLAAAGLGAYFTYKAAEPILDAYKIAGNTNSMRELNAASVQIGDAGGSFIVNTAIAAAGYKIGSRYTDRMLTSQAFDGFADAKANFYSKLGDTSTKMFQKISWGSSTESSTGGKLQSNFVNADGTVKFAASERSAPTGDVKGEVDPNKPMEVSVMLKSKATELKTQRTMDRIAQGRQAPLNDTQMAEQFGPSKESIDSITKFAQENNLKVSEINPASGRAVLSGTTGQMSEAFKTRLTEFEHPSGVTFHGREGSLSVPLELTKHVVAILGMDNRPQAKSYIVKFAGPVPEGPKDGPITPPPDAPAGPPKPPPGTDPRAVRGFMPQDVANAYNFPTESMGKGQGVAIIELGGGIDLADNAKYYEEHGLPQPSKINVIEIGGAKNAPGGAADGEVLLDSQVIGAIAPEATQNLIFAPNSEKGFIDAITRSTFPEAGETPNSSISISWGQNEEGWSKQAIDGMNAAFKKALLKGISIFAASGDDGAQDNAATRGKLLTDYPASDPQVTGSGGTRLEVGSNGKMSRETVWNNHRPNDAGGGGISQVFPPQDFQKDAKIPNHATTGQPGRGVPDIAGNADPVTGYRIRVGGFESLTGGTSAVSPLYSALMMRINGALDKPFSTPLNQWLYKNANSGIFNDVTIGDNNGYKAGPGWDAATGLGSIDGTKMLNAIRSNPHLPTNPGEFRWVGPGTTGSDTQQGK
jgi:kumamolisin